ncbi:MAG: DNA cytosine methyltransferase [Spirochaetales bacterium]|nr:DNA cytosine methyltransferase [Spirochaetales bacterium]
MAIIRKNAIELFCGAGGTSLGFQLSGAYRILLGMDFDPNAMATYCSNHEETECLTGDITKISPSSVASRICGSDVDIIIGGPSCQGYSTIGKRIADDPRNSLYSQYLNYVDEFRPKWIVFENVRGFIHSGKGRFFEAFKKSLAALGYSIAAGVLNAADYGVPQRRERVIIVGTNTDLTPSLPKPTHEDPRCPVCSRPDKSNRIRSNVLPEECPACKGTRLWHSKGMKPWVSLRDAIGDLPWLEDLSGTLDFVSYQQKAQGQYQKWIRGKSKGYTLHMAKAVSDYALSIISNIPAGCGIRSIPENELPERFRIMRTVKGGKLRRDCTTLYGRLGWNMPSYTITCYFGNVSSGAFTHPEVHRSLTLREAARLQSFPDSYLITAKSAMRQIGNAVPPLLAKSIADHIELIESGCNPLGLHTPDLSDVNESNQKALFL